MVDPTQEGRYDTRHTKTLNEPLRKHVGGPFRPRVFEVADKPRQWRVSVLRLLSLRRPPVQALSHPSSRKYWTIYGTRHGRSHALLAQRRV